MFDIYNPQASYTSDELAGAAKRISHARTTLLLDYPWFGALALRLRVEPRAKLRGAAATDGTHLYYRPDWALAAPDAELQAVIAHEVMHCALLHPYRMGSRDLERFNIAADFAINPLIRQSGLTLPDWVLDDPKYHDKSAEEIYGLLPNPDPKRHPQPDFTKPVPSGKKPDQGAPSGQDGPGESDQQDDQDGQGDPPPMSAADWQEATEQATLVAQKSGKAPAHLLREVAKTRETPTDWRAILRRFVEQVMPTDYSWSNPNRRYISQGMYLPGVIKEGCPRLGLAIDTSGSITQNLLNEFASELQAIIREVHPEGLDVIYVDTQVQRNDKKTLVEEYTDEDDIHLKAYGGGGTNFKPAFDFFNQRREEQPIAALLYFTDMWASDWERLTEPEYPTLWVTGQNYDRTPPFGEVVKMEIEI